MIKVGGTFREVVACFSVMCWHFPVESEGKQRQNNGSSLNEVV
jgi:hypothetical protein